MFSNKVLPICIIEPVTEKWDKTSVSGVLKLVVSENLYYIQWEPQKGNINKIGSNIDMTQITEIQKKQWIPGHVMNCDCANISSLRLEENPLAIVFLQQGGNGIRRFEIKDSGFFLVAELVWNMLKKGIAVPSNEGEFCLSVYSKCSKNSIFYVPPYIHLQMMKFDGLSSFWNEVNTFYFQVISHLDECDTLPKDPKFPLAQAARASHDRVMKRIYQFIKEYESSEPITVDNWDSLFNEQGVLINPEEFKKRVFDNSVEKSLRSKALPFIFGVYPLDSSSEERASIDQKLIDEYSVYKNQLGCIHQSQIDSNKKLNSNFRVISQDIMRTDRQHIAFADQKGPGLALLTQLLKIYCIFNPPIGYLQGMNDLFVPIMLSYIPKWNPEGLPFDENDKPIDSMELAPVIFWCFEAMLRNTNHISFLSSVTDQCQKKAQLVHKILQKISPMAAIWMRRAGLKDLLWIYSDLVLLFKRTYENVWIIWDQINCSSNPKCWLTYFLAALIMRSFDELSSIDDCSITTVMDVFPKIISKLDHKEIGLISLWLAKEYPLEVEEAKPPVNVDETDFFVPPK